MTRTTNARIAGFAFLFYIAAGVAIMVLLASVAQRTTSPLDHRARLALDDERSDAGDDTLRSHARPAPGARVSRPNLSRRLGRAALDPGRREIDILAAKRSIRR
jgi:hypothetical protein